MPGGDLSIQTREHPNPRGRWVAFTITVAGFHDLEVVLDPGSPVSVISPEARDELTSLNLLQQSSDPRYEYRLTSLTVQGQLFPDLDVRILRKLTRLQIVGLVGPDFLWQFRAIHFDVPTRRLVLEYP